MMAAGGVLRYARAMASTTAADTSPMACRGSMLSFGPSLPLGSVRSGSASRGEAPSEAGWPR